MGARPLLLFDNKMVNPITFEGSVTDHQRNLSVTFWGNVPISETDSMIEVQVLSTNGELLGKVLRRVHFGQAPVRAELVRDVSYLIADGIYPPVLAVKLYDRNGHPARSGISGEFAVDAPYQPLDKTKHLESTTGLSGLNYKMLKDGIAYIQLEPTTDTGEVTLTSGSISISTVSKNQRTRIENPVPGTWLETRPHDFSRCTCLAFFQQDSGGAWRGVPRYRVVRCRIPTRYRPNMGCRCAWGRAAFNEK